MKSILEFLCSALLSTAIASENSCEPWSSELKSVGKSCYFPTASTSSGELFCSKNCTGKQSVAPVYRKCMMECLSAATPLLTADKKINKTVVMFHPALFPSGVNPVWQMVMVEAIDKCEFEPSGDVNLDLTKFFHCVRVDMKKFCVFFKLHTPGCDLVAEHFMKCHDYKPVCSIVTAESFDATCCSVPQVFAADLEAKCIKQCKQEEYFRSLLRRSFLDCITNGTKIMKDNKIDFEAVKSLLVENFNSSEEWTDSIGKAIKLCAETYEEAQFNSRAGSIQFIAHCASYQLAYDCPSAHFNDVPTCRQQKQFHDYCKNRRVVVTGFCWAYDILGCFHYGLHDT